MEIFLITLSTILIKALGGLFAVRFKDRLHLILGFSAGTVLGVAFFDLLPESVELAGNAYSMNTITILIAAGFSIYMLLDRSFSLHLHDQNSCENERHSGALGAAALTLHSFLDGFGIGIAFKVSAAVGWIVTIAVLSHGFWDGINTVNMILKNEGEKKTALKWLAAASLAPALGIASTYWLTISSEALGLILAVFIGLFIYIGASDLVPESHHEHPTLYTSMATIIGMALILVVVSLSG